MAMSGGPVGRGMLESMMEKASKKSKANNKKTACKVKKGSKK
jgi:hypothetical protein